MMRLDSSKVWICTSVPGSLSTKKVRPTVTKVQLPNGKTGYIFHQLITDTWIKVLKDERQLLLMKGNSILKRFPVALGFNPKNDKIRQGDGCTPEGRFYICEIIEKPKPPETYGPVSLRISYPNIYHRRTRNLKIFFDHHAKVLTNETPLKKPDQWRPGDIVLMDTGINNGTIYDHIGIVSSRKNSQEIPLVINLWTVGWKLNEMELLNGDYPDIVGHYRLHHPFYYGTL